MNSYFKNTVLSSTILGMSVVPVFGAIGYAPHHTVIDRPAIDYSTFMTEPDLHLIQEQMEGDYGGSDGGAVNDESESDQRFRQSGKKVKKAGAQARPIILLVEEGENFCSRLDAGIRVDCLAENYERTARTLSDAGEEAVVKKSLNDAAGKLRKIVQENRDTEASRVVPTVKTRKVNRKASRPLTPIKKEKIPQANREARAVVEELSTVLLRSAENSEERAGYYTQIASAVDSNKVLLRS